MSSAPLTSYSPLLCAQLESLKREVQALETEQATTDGGVVPFHAPPLRDDTVTVTNGNGNGAPAWVRSRGCGVGDGIQGEAGRARRGLGSLHVAT